ncbi:MAG: DUF6484 domain-containing protein [Gammaproteobacteria bacterium]|nr:DUF6484 domain-containing protein [Gammaproteobacteria bacterium]
MSKETDESPFELKVCSDNSRNIIPGEIVIGTIVGLDASSQPLVEFPENPQKSPLPAVSTQAIYNRHIGREAALLFANGDPAQPVIMGLLHNPLNEMLETFEEPVTEIEQAIVEKPDKIDDLTVDGKRITIEGHEEIVLKCGASSITLTKEGKILIRGKYLMNRSTGVNRILGGTVQIN